MTRAAPLMVAPQVLVVESVTARIVLPVEEPHPGSDANVAGFNWKMAPMTEPVELSFVAVTVRLMLLDELPLQRT